MFTMEASGAYRRLMVRCALSLVCVTQFPNARAFESSMSSTFSPALFMSASTFKNVLTQAGSFSTAVEYKSVECEHVTDTIGNIDIGALYAVSLVKLEEVLVLTKRLDDIQYQLCKSMIPSGKSAELTVKLGSAWKATLRTGDALQKSFAAIIQSEDYVQELIDKYTVETNKLQEIVKSTGGEK